MATRPRALRQRLITVDRSHLRSGSGPLMLQVAANLWHRGHGVTGSGPGSRQPQSTRQYQDSLGLARGCCSLASADPARRGAKTVPRGAASAASGAIRWGAALDILARRRDRAHEARRRVFLLAHPHLLLHHHSRCGSLRGGAVRVDIRRHDGHEPRALLTRGLHLHGVGRRRAATALGRKAATGRGRTFD